MMFKKTAVIATVAGALAGMAVPALAVENEFHGTYRAYGFATNALSGGSGFNLSEKSATDKFIEQRARLQYIAKANEDLKLVTQFEFDTKFGGSSSTKYPIGDGGGLDADRLNIETKNLYLDFTIAPIGLNVKTGVQPYNDAYQGTFGNIDGAGAVFSKKFDKVTASYGYFIINSDASNQFATTASLTSANTSATGTGFPSNAHTTDLNILDVKVAVSNDVTVGVNYSNILSGSDPLFLNLIGISTAAKLGPAAVTASLGYQFGDSETVGRKLSAFGGTVAAKVNAGPGKINVAALYLQGDNSKDSQNTAWHSIGNDAGAKSSVNYFAPANMWLISRNSAAINSATAVGGTPDLTRAGLGLLGFFVGYEGTADKVFYNANAGYAQVDQKRAADSAVIGSEVNATIGYKLYTNLSASVTAAYAFLGDGYNKDKPAALLSGGTAKADNPFLSSIALNYSF